jgi:hypothetical protein
MPARRSSRTVSPPHSTIDRPRRREISPERLERLRAAALARRPWERSTGPRTPEGKRRSARNSSLGRVGPSVSRLRAELADVFNLIARMTATRRSLS